MLRVLIAIPAAFVMALGLFTFMAWMVDNGHQPPDDDKKVLAFDMVMVEQEREAQRRNVPFRKNRKHQNRRQKRCRKHLPKLLQQMYRQQCLT